MSEFVDGRTWILETLFQIAESSNLRIHDLMFIPTREGQKLMLKLEGRIACARFESPEVLYCGEGTTTMSNLLVHRAKVRKQLQELLTTVPWKELRLVSKDLVGFS
jgi:hypothetical protein